MRIVVVHNRYSKTGGEESVVAMQVQKLVEMGHQVRLFERDYAETKKWRFGAVSSFFSALYNRRSVKEINLLIKEFRPEAALVHNVFPVVSPAVLRPLRVAGVKILYFTHNYRLVCPIGTCFCEGQICTLCGSSPKRELNCVVKRCEGSLMGSVAFAARGWWSRRSGAFAKNVSLYCTQSEFQSEKLKSFHLKAMTDQNLAVLHNALNVNDLPLGQEELPRTKISFVGRFSQEKGAEIFIAAAARLPHLEFQVAGVNCMDATLIPRNVEMRGVLTKSELASFYSQSIAILSTSICWETFGLTIIEGMTYGAVGVVPNLAAMPDLVDDGRCGVVYQCGSVEKLCDAIEKLVANKEHWQTLSHRGQQRVRDVYSVDRYVEKLTALISKS